MSNTKKRLATTEPALVTPTKASKNYHKRPGVQDAEKGQDTARQEELGQKPERQEASPHSRAKCQRCKETIRQGEQRRGKDYDKGYRWWHVGCWDVYHHRYRKDPSGKAKCRKCNQKISSGTLRVEKEFYDGPGIGYTFQYYHVTCLTSKELHEMKLDHVKTKAPSKKAPSKASTKNDGNEKLRKELKKLRSVFAAKLNCQHFKIYSDEMVDELVKKMPQNDKQLLDVPGMGDKKLRSFGSAILTIIKQHQPQSKITDFFQVKKRQPDVKLVGTLSCEEIVKHKFDDAKKNGYVVEVD